MRRQRGFTLSQLMLWGFVLFLVLAVGMKVAPSAIEYYKTLSAVKGVAANAQGQSTVPDLRKAYSRQAEIDHLKVVKPEDLEITKDGGQIVINFNFNEKVPLAGPVSLLIEYQGSSSGKARGE